MVGKTLKVHKGGMKTTEPHTNTGEGPQMRVTQMKAEERAEKSACALVRVSAVLMMMCAAHKLASS